MKIRNAFTKKKLEKAVKSGTTWRQVLSYLKLRSNSTTIATVQCECYRLQVDLSSMKGQSWRAGNKDVLGSVRAPLDELLVKNSRGYGRSTDFRRKLIAAGLKVEMCNSCGITKWMGLPPPLILRTKNDIDNDLRIENIELICPNCEVTIRLNKRKNNGIHPKRI